MINETLHIRFIPIFEDREFIEAANEYALIWREEGNRILDVIQKVTNLTFIESRIAAVVYDGVSFSGRSPKDIMKIRFSYDTENKKATLVHELSHRLLFNLINKPDTDEHQTLFLFLYDVWIELYGDEFANKMVETEKVRDEKYFTAWSFALSFTKEQRREKFTEFLGIYK